jgi:multiple sugar transport system ATP-binding protein
VARVVLENVAKDFTGPRHQPVGAVRDLNLTVEAGEFLVIVGPSGCGKTTTLRLIAGLEAPDRGLITLDGKSMAGVPPKDRDVAMVFQNHALLPHLTVYENMAFGLVLRKFPREEIARRVRQAAEMLGLTALLERKPGELSGGEGQRTALGRALVRQPKVFLFDEPLSNLDAPMRLQLRAEIAAVRRRVGATLIYVTHDQAEAMALADRIAVMRDGAVQQTGSPLELYRRPANFFVAGFIGAPPMNFFPGTLASANDNLVFNLEGNEKSSFPIIDSRTTTLSNSIGRPVTLGLRPEHFSLEEKQKDQCRMSAALERVEATGSETLVYLKAGIGWVVRASAAFSAPAGQSVEAYFAMTEALFFDSMTGALLA